MATATLSPAPKLQFFDANGNPLVGGKLYSYAAGTTTPLATYTGNTTTTANTNPVILNSRGEAGVWLSSSYYKLKLTDSNDVEIWTVDNVGGFATMADLTAAIAAHKVSLEDVFYGGLTGMPGQAVAQGYVALEFSDDSHQALAHQLLFWSVALGLLGIALAWLIADRLSRRVMRPVFRSALRRLARATSRCSHLPPRRTRWRPCSWASTRWRNNCAWAATRWSSGWRRSRRSCA